jgi:hypothetical protein
LPLPHFEEAGLNFGLGLSTLPSAHPVAFSVFAADGKTSFELTLPGADLVALGVFVADGEAGFEVPLPSADFVAFDVFSTDRETSLKLTLPGADLVSLVVSATNGLRLCVSVSITGTNDQSSCTYCDATSVELLALASANLVTLGIFAADCEAGFEVPLPGAHLISLTISTTDGLRLWNGVSTLRRDKE